MAHGITKTFHDLPTQNAPELKNLKVTLWLAAAILGISCSSPSEKKTEEKSDKIIVIFDTDANNELDDQHALAYLLSNADIFDIKGVTVNATRSGGDIEEQFKEAERILQLYNLKGKIPLLKGANASFDEIRSEDSLANDGKEAVDFMIEKANEGPLTIIAVGKLSTVALAEAKDSSFADKVRLVWLGSNYPEPGEYNLNNDISSMNYLLDSSIPFEIVTVRYGKPSGTDAVKATAEEINRKMPGMGPKAAEPITGRHGDTFSTFGDYSINLFDHIEMHSNPPSRALFDMAAVAVVKNPEWADKVEIPAPVMVGETWEERPENTRKVMIWENFKTKAIMDDFYDRMEHYVLE